MKIALTGATGFIGRHVLAGLLDHEVEILAITRKLPREPETNKRIRYVEMDIAHPTPNCFEHLGRPDILIHLAWKGLPNYNSPHHYEIELPLQYQFLKSMVEAGLPSLLVTGTCFEYGMQSGPLAANMPTKPNNPYGFAKDSLRKQLDFLNHRIPFNFIWARLFYMFGEGQPDSSLYSQLKNAVSKKDKFFNMSGGEQLRDYLKVEEVAQNIIQLALSPRNMGAVNICSGIPISIRKLVEGWIKTHAWEIEPNLGFFPYPDYEPMAFWGEREILNAGPR